MLRPSPKFFKLHAPLLETGVKNVALYETDTMWMHLKVYADGGENDLHAHPQEEHSFIVLHGEATFFVDADEKEVVARQYDGVLIPKGALYRFRSTGNCNLVMLRTGTGSNVLRAENRDTRTDPKGNPFPVNLSQVKKGHNVAVPIPGKFWPADQI